MSFLSARSCRRRLEYLEPRLLLASLPELVADINRVGAGSHPRSFVEVGGTVYFTANDGLRGEDLWKTDGSPNGTLRVKDIAPGEFSYGYPSSRHPRNLTNVGGTLYFSGDAGIWKSDGTDLGTELLTTVKSIPVRIGGIHYFSGQDGEHGSELWKSNGTPQGTVLVKDIRPGKESSWPGGFTDVGGTLFFVASDGAGTELWKSDGTTAGTVRVTDINRGPSGSYPHNLIEANGLLFFTANDGVTGINLWMSDGTTTGTVRVKSAGGPITQPQYLTKVGDTLFFTESNNANGQELWKSDGTVAGTGLVRDIIPGTRSSSPSSLRAVGGSLFFHAGDEEGRHTVWVSDGSEAGTVRWLEELSPSIPVEVNGTLFFAGKDAKSGSELWKRDGIHGGFSRVKDIRTGASSSYPNYLANAGGTLYFSAHDGVAGNEVWKSDGTEGGTVLVKDINLANERSIAGDLIDVAGKLLFPAYDGEQFGHELWTSDGTEVGTELLKKFEGNGFSRLVDFNVINEQVYFVAADSEYVAQVWKSDGSLAGTNRLDVGDFAFNKTWNLAAAGGLLYFFAAEGLRRSDGTENGTFTVAVPSGGGESSCGYIKPADIGGITFFALTETSSGCELWKSDGTREGTVLVKDIWAGGQDSLPRFMTDVSGTLFFVALEESGVALWKSDGTEPSTVRMQSFQDIHSLVNVNGTLYFAARQEPNGWGLWRSDGTSDGTWLVKGFDDFAYPPNGPQFLTDVGGTLYFSAYDKATGWELWKSDGTSVGTTLLKNILPDEPGVVPPFGSSPRFLTNINGTLYFSANDGQSGFELWTSDGTEAGTVLVSDISPGIFSSSPSNITSLGGNIYFVADDGVHGQELWVLRPEPILGDLDGDRDVDSMDLQSFLANWTGALMPGAGGRDQSTGDLDGDADVDSNDMLAFLEAWTGSKDADVLRRLPAVSIKKEVEPEFAIWPPSPTPEAAITVRCIDATFERLF